VGLQGAASLQRHSREHDLARLEPDQFKDRVATHGDAIANREPVPAAAGEVDPVVQAHALADPGTEGTQGSILQLRALEEAPRDRMRRPLQQPEPGVGGAPEGDAARREVGAKPTLQPAGERDRGHPLQGEGHEDRRWPQQQEYGGTPAVQRRRQHPGEDGIGDRRSRDQAGRKRGGLDARQRSAPVRSRGSNGRGGRGRWGRRPRDARGEGHDRARLIDIAHADPRRLRILAEPGDQLRGRQ
jgi:hypothetical protein